MNEGQGRGAAPEPRVTQKHGFKLSRVVQPHDVPASGAWLELGWSAWAWCRVLQPRDSCCSLQQLGKGSPGWGPTHSVMDSPSPGSVATTTTRHAEPENTTPALAEVLHARPAISPWLATACPCLLHSPGWRGSHAPSPSVLTHTHITPCLASPPRFLFQLENNAEASL